MTLTTTYSADVRTCAAESGPPAPGIEQHEDQMIGAARSTRNRDHQDRLPPLLVGGVGASEPASKKLAFYQFMRFSMNHVEPVSCRDRNPMNQEASQTFTLLPHTPYCLTLPRESISH